MAEFRRGPAEVGDAAQLPFGAAQALNEFEPPQDEDNFVFEDEDFLEDEFGAVEDEEPQPLSGDLQGMDALLFEQTDRPDEPITSGVPFGDGPSFVDRRESAQDIEDQAMRQLANSNNPRVRRFAQRRLNGE